MKIISLVQEGEFTWNRSWLSEEVEDFDFVLNFFNSEDYNESNYSIPVERFLKRISQVEKYIVFLPAEQLEEKYPKGSDDFSILRWKSMQSLELRLRADFPNVIAVRVNKYEKREMHFTRDRSDSM